MEGSDDASLDQRPEPFDSLSVDVTVYVFAFPMIHGTVREVLVDVAIAFVFVGRYQADLVGNDLTYKAVKRGRVGAVNHASNDVAFTLHGSDDNGLSRSSCSASASGSAWPPALVFVPILRLYI